MAEFVLLTPVIIAMWMGINYFRAGYARRIDALEHSESKAWALAFANNMACYKQGSQKFGAVAGAGSDLAGGGSQAQQAVDTFSSNAGSSSSLFMWGHADVVDSESIHTNAAFGHMNATLSGRTYITCNEVVPNGSNDDNVATPLMSFIKGVFPSF